MNAQDGVYYLRVGDDFSIKFTEYTLEMCSDEVYISQKNDSTYWFSEPLAYDEIAQIVKLKIKVPFDSATVEAAYENRFGVLYSETEGAMIYDGDDLDAVHFSGWRKAKVLDQNRKYSLRFFGFKKGFVNNDPPAMDKKKVKYWCENKEWCPPHPVSVFCAEMIVRVSIYSGGKRKNYYIHFNRRVGEC